MTRLIILFILGLFIFIPDVSACTCNAGKATGTYCGFELSGDDCGGEYSTHIWECNGLGSRAANIGPCIRGCCAPSGKKSFCCKDNACTGCTSSDILKRPMELPTSQPVSPVTNDSTNTSVNSSSPSTQPDMSADTAGSNESLATIVGSIIGGVSTIVAAILAAVIGVRCKKRARRRLSNNGV